MLTTTDPFLVVNRHKPGRGTRRVARAVTFGGAVAVEFEVPATETVIRIPVLTSTDLATLGAILDRGGRVTVDPGGTGTPLAAVLADRGECDFQEFNGPYPDGGGSVPLVTTQTRVDIPCALIE